MKKTALKRCLPIAALALGVGACSSVRYGDAQAEETVNVDWGSTDLQTFSEAMVASLLESPQLSYLSGAGKENDLRIIAYMGDVVNETTEHVSTTGVTDSIRTALIQSGRFRFVAGDPGQAEIGDQVRFQQGSGRVREDMAKAFGKQLGADVVLYGSLRSIEKEKGRTIESLGAKKRDKYYQFVLNCVNIETGEIIWANEEEIRKTAVASLFGRV